MWGSDEPCLALKILMSGGKMLMCKKIEAGHIFRNSAPYTTGIHNIVYNKIRMAKTLLPEELGNKLLSLMPQDGNYQAAMNLCEKEKDTLAEYREYYKSIFTKSIGEVCKEYNIHLPV
jgi:hypothetical protein